MRLALCLEYPISVRGGVSVLVETLVREFSRSGDEVVLVSADSPETLRTAEVGSHIADHISWNPADVSTSTATALASRLAAARLDLAHFHLGGNYGWGNRLANTCPIVRLARAGVPCLSTVHLVVSLLDGYCGPDKPTWFKLLALPLAWWGKLQQLRSVRFEIAVSQHDFHKLRRWYCAYARRFVQVYHGRMRLSDSPQNHGPARGPVILNVGHMAWRKGQLVLAQAFARVAARHPQWQLQLAGHDGGDDTVQKIRQLAAQPTLSGRILLLGERTDALDLMRRASIYVQPSFWEALGLALQEAMFCGCATAGSRAGGIPELIRDGQTGLLFEPGNVAQLADILDRLMSDGTLRERLARSAAASIRERGMTVESMVERHRELYALAVGPRENMDRAGSSAYGKS